MRRHFVMIAIALAIAGRSGAASIPTGPTIAILDFQAVPSGRTLPPPGLGVMAAQLLLDRLVASGQYRVLDARWLYESGRLPPEGPLVHIRQTAHDAGADYLVLGTITRFSEEEKQRGGGLVLPLPILGGLRRQRTELVVGVTVRLVDTRTGEVVTTAAGNGVATRSNVSVGGLAFAPLGGAGVFSRGSARFRDAQLAEAIERSIGDASAALAKAAPRLAQERQP